MSYAGIDHHQMTLPLASGDASPDPKGWLIYSVSVHIDPEGHACTYLGSVDRSTRRFLSEKQGCYQVTGQTRKQALLAIASAVTQLLLEVDAEGR